MKVRRRGQGGREREGWKKDEAWAAEERKRDILERWNNGRMRHQPDGKEREERQI